MGKLFVINVSCYVLKGSKKLYNDYSIGDNNLGDAIIDTLQNYDNKKDYPYIDNMSNTINHTNSEVTYNLIIDLDIFNSKNLDIQVFIQKVQTELSTIYRKYNALFNINSKNDPIFNTFDPKLNGGGYNIGFFLKDLYTPAPPVSKFRINYDSNKFPTEIKIIDESKNAVKYQYDFGDGEKSILKEPNKIYTIEGTYTITLTTVSNDNLSNTYSQTITVKKPIDPIVDEKKQEIISEIDDINDDTNDDIEENTDKVSNVNEIKPEEQAKNIVIETSKNKDYQKEFIRGAGFYPVIHYNSLLIDNSSIEYFSLYNDGFIPCISLNFYDSSGMIKSKSFPLDDTKIKVFISSRSNNLKSIILDFKISHFRNNDGLMIIEGILHSSKLYTKGYSVYSETTSYKALKKICTDIGIGFNSNINDTNDSMNWLQSGKKYSDFIESIIQDSYISDKTFLSGYIDYHQCFNYIDVEKEMERDINEQHGINTTGIESANDNSAKIDIQPLILTNDESMSESNNYFSKFKIINRATEISSETGYIQNTSFYDRNKKQLVSFKIDSITKDESSKIILKGNPNDNNSLDNNQNSHYLGKLDTSNVHSNYFYTKINNWKNLTDLGKIEIKIELDNPNFNLYQFQKVKLILSNKTPMGGDDSMINTRLSGDWLLIDIGYIFTQERFYQTFRLVKRELEVSKDELDAEKNNTNTDYKKENYENTTNPDPNPDTTGTPALVDYSNTLIGVRNVPVIPPPSSKYLQLSSSNDDIFYYIRSFIEGGYTWDCRIDIQNLGLGTYEPKRTPFPPIQFRRPVPKNKYGNPISGIEKFKNSGETLYGIDRSNNDGGIEDKQTWSKFWNLVDAYKTTNLPGEKVSFMTCHWEFEPSKNSNFYKLASRYSFDFMYKRYLSYSKRYFTSSQISFFEKDARLRFHFIYACYNGIGFFINFSNSYKVHLSQTQNYDQLVKLCLKDRINYSNKLIVQGGLNIRDKVFGPQYA